METKYNYNCSSLKIKYKNSVLKLQKDIITLEKDRIISLSEKIDDIFKNNIEYPYTIKGIFNNLGISLYRKDKLLITFYFDGCKKYGDDSVVATYKEYDIVKSCGSYYVVYNLNNDYKNLKDSLSYIDDVLVFVDKSLTELANNIDVNENQLKYFFNNMKYV